MRRFKSKFTRERGQLRKDRAASDLSPGLRTMRAEILDGGGAESDWAELLEQRKKEIDAFRERSIPLPRWDIGARIPRLYPGEPVPTDVESDLSDLLAQRAAEIRATRPDLLREAGSSPFPSVGHGDSHPAACHLASWQSVFRLLCRLLALFARGRGNSK